ncbi:MAG: beta-N-acetylhexosaminidase [Chitinophagaceae bacterium]
MKRSLFFILSVLALTTAHAQDCPVIPTPVQAVAVNETFIINNNTPVIAKTTAAKKIASFFQQQLLQTTGVSVKQQASGKQPAIVLEATPLKGPPGQYRISMTSKQVLITATDEDGLFSGIATILQLARLSYSNSNSISLPCWNINDQPQYQWRGFMLDESRHFFGTTIVKAILDQMALYKLNRFHWHLTDEPGWRLEIKKYPRLATIGGIGNQTDSTAPAAYYTQQQVREIIAYAAERHITVIPEIDMPGHATAANKAYPEFSGGGSAKHPEFTFHPGKEGTYQYLANILKETDQLFSSQMIHIGGDEVSFGNEKWQQDTAIQQLMKKEKLDGVLQVEHYFLRRMADTLARLHNKVLAWDEVTEAGLDPKNTIVFWWRHDKPAQFTNALQKGFPVVVCPRLPFYYDFVQDSSHKSGRKWEGKFNPVENIYNFSVSIPPADSTQLKQVLGIQANIWTETITTPQRLGYMLFPRLYALAETSWRSTQPKNYQQFAQRLPLHFSILKKDGFSYYDPNNPAATPEIKK